MATIKNNAKYERTFFGVDVTIESKKQVIDRDDYSVLIKNCVNFQQMTNPPSYGGQPVIRILGSTPSGDVRINASELGESTMFTAPQVKLNANGDNSDGLTEVPKNFYKKLRTDSRFQSLLDAGELEVIEEEEQ